MLTQLTPIQLNGHSNLGHPIAWSADIVVSGFLIGDYCSSFEDVDYLRMLHGANENTDLEGTCAYIDLSRTPPMPPPLILPSQRGHLTWKQQQEAKTGLIAGLEAALNKLPSAAL